MLYFLCILKFGEDRNIYNKLLLYFKLENYLKPKTVWVRDKQFWNRKIKRMMRSDTTSELDDLIDSDRELPQISDTRFISETKKVPAIALIR